MTTIYVVTEGEYSDYTILGLFSEEAIAQRFIERWSGRIEGYELDGFAPCLDKPMYFVEMERDGTTRRVHLIDYPEKPGTKLAKMEFGGIWTRRLILFCFANDEKHAVKIANEKRVQFIASGEWPSKGE